MNVSSWIRIAAALLWTSAIGLGVFCPPGIRNVYLGRAILRVRMITEREPELESSEG